MVIQRWQGTEDYLRDFFEYAPVGFHAFGPDQKIIDMNQTELDMFGYTRKEIIGKKSWRDLILPEEIPLFERHWQDINTKGEVRNLSYTVVRKDGQCLNVLLNASARFDKNGKLLNTRGSVVDITERYQMARVLKLHDSIQKNIEDSIFPLLEKLKRRGTFADQQNLTLLEQYLQDLMDGFSVKLMDKKWRLSAREIEICKMLKKGLKTKDIADLLSTSQRTIEHHRNHIRKKFGISNPSADLSKYLKEFSIQ
jgi:PAS domain S-box-containing protein